MKVACCLTGGIVRKGVEHKRSRVIFLHTILEWDPGRGGHTHLKEIECKRNKRLYLTTRGDPDLFWSSFVVVHDQSSSVTCDRSALCLLTAKPSWMKFNDMTTDDVRLSFLSFSQGVKIFLKFSIGTSIFYLSFRNNRFAPIMLFR